MTLEESAQPFIERAIGGTTYKLMKMTVRERCRLMNDLKQQRRAKLLEAMNLAGLDKNTVVGSIADFDAEGMTERDFIEYINTLDGQAAVITASLQKHHAAVADDTMDLITEPALPLVADLCGLSMTTPQVTEPGSPNENAAPVNPAGAAPTPANCYES